MKSISREMCRNHGNAVKGNVKESENETIEGGIFISA